jgi:PAS domain S-box-containing protein
VHLCQIGGMDEPKPTEDQLVQAEDFGEQTLSLLETLQSSAPVGFGFVDRDFRYIRVNQKLAAINGYSVAEHIGRTVAEVVPDLWPNIEPLYRRVLDSGESLVNIEMTGETGAEPGRIHYWAATFYPVHSDDRVIGIGVLVIDITERKRAEEFRSVVMDNMAEGLFALDADGRLMYMNRAASAMLGWTDDELRGKPMHETVHFQRADGSTVPIEDCALLQVRTKGRTIRIVDEAFTRKNGSIFPVAYSSAPLRSGTTVQGIVVVFRDITQEKEDYAVGQREIASLSWVGRVRDAIDENRFVLYSQPIVPLANGRMSEELLLRMIGRDGEIILPGTFLHVANWRDRPLGDLRSRSVRGQWTSSNRSQPFCGVDRDVGPSPFHRTRAATSRCRPKQPRFRDHRDGTYAGYFGRRSLCQRSRRDRLWSGPRRLRYGLWQLHISQETAHQRPQD